MRVFLQPKTCILQAVVALLYVLAARWGLMFWVAHGNISLVWPPAGLAVGAILIGGYRVVPGIAVGAFLATASTGAPLGFALATAVGNPLEAVLGAYLLRRLVGFRNALDRVRDVIGLLLLAAVLSTTVAATIGVVALSLQGLAPWSAFLMLWRAWWLGDALGVLMLAPVLLTWTARGEDRWTTRRALEAGGFFVLVGIVGQLVFGYSFLPRQIDLPAAYIVFAVLLWAAFRYGPTGSATASMLIAAIAVAGTARERGPFAGHPLQDELYLLLTFIAVSAVTALILSAIRAERNRAVVALARARDGLELQVLERTADLSRANAGLQAEIVERGRAEAALEQSRSFLQTVIDGIPQRMIVVDRTYQVVLANRAAQVAAAAKGSTSCLRCLESVRDGSVPCGDSVEACPLQQVVLTKAPVTAEHAYADASGNPRVAEVTMAPVLDAAGQVVQVIQSCRDVTERHRGAELARLQRDLALALAASDNLDDALRLCVDTALRVGDLDVGGVYLINELSGALELACQTGLPAELAERAAYFAPESPGTQAILAGRAIYGSYTEVAGRLAPGLPPTPLQALAILPISHLGRVIGSLQVASLRRCELSDLTRAALETIAAQIGTALARLRAEDARRRLATAVEQAAEGVVITDAKGRIEYANPAFERITGYTHAETVGQNPRILRSDRHDAEFYRQLWETITRGETWSGRFVNKKKDGTLYHEDATISPVRDATGQIVNYVGLKKDVTREVMLEAQLRQSQKLDAVGQLAGGIAHEFNNVLTAILGYSEIIAGGVSTDHPAHGHAQRIRKSCDRATELVQSLLTFGRKQIVQPRILSINDVVADAVKLLRPLLGAHIDIDQRLEATTGLVRADFNQVVQLIVNLGLNARDAMPGGGTLTLETAVLELQETYQSEQDSVAPGRYVTLAVHDTGRGLDEKARVHLFEPFFTTKAHGQSAGLGLATVYGIVHCHGGRIVVHSVPGHGTTFRVYLPRVTDALELPLLANETARQQRREATLLLVEDEEEVRDVARDILEAEGYSVMTAGNGAAALELGRQYAGPIDVLVSDIVMPGMSGRELAERLTAERPATRVLYISGYAASFLSTHGHLAPEMAFLAKPFTRSQLAAKVREVLGSTPTSSAPALAVPLSEAAR